MKKIILVCESCGRQVEEGQDIKATFHENGCDHMYQRPDDPKVAMFRDDGVMDMTYRELEHERFFSDQDDDFE